MQESVPTAPRCWVDGDLQEGKVALSPAEYRHLEKVRRIRAGEAVCVLNGTGQIGTGVLSTDGTVEVQHLKSVSRPQPELTLFMGALKQSAWEEVLKHATELGVVRIVRVETEHGVAKLEGKEEKKRARWRDLLVEACKQSANPCLPELELVTSVREALELPQPPECSWVAQIGGEVHHPGEVLSSSPMASCGVWIGPEGDFSSGELTLLRDKGVLPIGLGERVLRAETAALALLSLLRLYAH